MVRTQIYLTTEEHTALDRIARVRQTKKSVVIRDALDAFIKANRGDERRAALKRAAGLWKDRRDLPDFRRLRQELDRTPPR